MYSRTQLATKYLAYYWRSSNGKGHGMHSPFIFHFITQVLNDKTKYKEYELVENLRLKMRQDNRVLAIRDFGAGSTQTKNNLRSITSIAKNAAKPKKYGQLLYRMVKTYQPQTILELGTSLGITSSYLASAKKDAVLITMEGAEEVAAIAKQNFQSAGLTNIQIVEGNFDATLPVVLADAATVDFVFIDGNHRQQPTEDYFQQLLSTVNNDSILIFDDIHWSAEMEAAWETIKSHPAVRCSVDLFFIGIVFFRAEFREKQHFTIRF